MGEQHEREKMRFGFCSVRASRAGGGEEKGGDIRRCRRARLKSRDWIQREAPEGSEASRGCRPGTNATGVGPKQVPPPFLRGDVVPALACVGLRWPVGRAPGRDWKWCPAANAHWRDAVLQQSPAAQVQATWFFLGDHSQLTSRSDFLFATSAEIAGAIAGHLLSFDFLPRSLASAALVACFLSRAQPHSI